MKKIILAAAAASLALSGVAYADATTQDPAIKGHAIEYGENPSGANLDTTQPSGGKVSDELGAATGNISGSVTGAANMNGPLRNGEAVDSGFMLRNSSPVFDEGY
jgi:hypothetical protein